MPGSGRLRAFDLSLDLRQALRGLRRDPVFTLTSLAILALGCGALTAMLTAVYGLLLAPLPYSDPDRLVSLYEFRQEQPNRPGSRRPVALGTLPEWRGAASLERLAGYRLRSFGLQTSALSPHADQTTTSLSEIEVVQVGMSTAGLFRTFGVEPTVGRSFTREEEELDLAVAVISFDLWQKAFAGSPEILTQSLWLNGSAHTILGVLPRDFRMVIHGQVPSVYIPISHADYGGSRTKRALEVVARLNPKVELSDAELELGALGKRLAAAWPESHHGLTIGVESLDHYWRGSNRRPLSFLLTGAILLLAIACANVAGLMLARTLRRRRQRAIRAALGAGGLRLATPTVLEGMLIGLGGGFAGIWVAGLALEALPLALPVFGGAAPIAGFDLSSLRLSPGLAAFTVGLALFSGLVFGSWPAWRLRLRPPAVDLGAARSPGLASPRGQAFVVVTQVALGTLLLLAAGLLGRSFQALLTSDPGFDSAGLTHFGLGLPESRYGDEQTLIDFHRDLHRELSHLPGVSVVGAAARRPLLRGFKTSFERDDERLSFRERPSSAINVVSADYFRALRIPLLAGRLPDWRDDAQARRVLVVNDAFARAHLGDSGSGQDSLGRQLRLSWWSELTARGTPWEIVGLVGDIHQQSLDAAPQPEIYLPMSQYPSEGATYLLRSVTGEPVSVTRIAGIVEGLDPELQQIHAGDSRRWAAESLADRRLALMVVTLFGFAALLMTAIGVYALVATDVASRRSEIAVRLALGARLDQISSLVIGRSLRLVSLGFALGAASFAILSPGLRHMLYGVSATDPFTYAGIWILLALMAFMASAPSASRASKTSVIQGLRG